ncbi:AzlC family ABC transporter permease [Devosia aurantiaca]|uniref:AzlC family ABC transporter permease n=1 Tax=Devosia aurantiaca TaxID=2714858 RepID=A0A6M1SLN7_9HYPH|nr:AzlC family ABC transporter permease [Devosia aurantiaca]NGP17684.1 AzlC family ABC transporter permease [Devosia aurantiaca]
MTQAANPFDSRRSQFLAGARACLPVAISVAAYGLVWGVLARGAGLTLTEAVLMSGLVFAGSAQFVALDLWTATPATLPIGPIVIATLIVNLRYLLLTATLRPLYPKKGVWRGALSMYLVTDENWAMTVAAMQRGGGSVAFLMGGGALAWISWMSTNLIGYGLGSAIDDPARWGLDFAFTATFLALLLGMWKGRSDLIPWLVAALAAILTSRLVDGSWHILVGGLAGSLVGAALETRKHAHQF